MTRIIDGDTVGVRARRPGRMLPSTSSVTVRLLEVDTPETKKPGEPVQCYGPEATRFTAALLPVGSAAYVQADREPRDRYGRYLLYMWTAGGAFVEEEIVRTGHGRAVLYAPNDRYITGLRAVEARARAAGRGLWSACRTSATSLPRPAGSGGAARSTTGYSSCAAARAAGAAPLQAGEPGYSTRLDQDRDGVACE